ncbi:DNA-directed RNA polymerase I subunit RPA49-like [Cylas formicarius]|uniref:DNA-directed RNA polymerase I subunit RPA49-like n=1 Tax=Cylas formicarius TaxID=197179 RepID=UPI0029586661|nr:DNA-directed RNA polymerase I subunit RPA49-like [Cylas formicarius]
MSQITEVVTDVKRPIFVEFQNEFELDLNANIKSRILKDKISRKRIFGLATENMVYCGEIKDQDELYNNFLLVHDPTAREIKLLQVDNCSMAPLLISSTVNTKSPITERSSAHLKKEFGSKRSKRMTEQQERLQMNLENVKEHLESTVADVEVTQVDSTMPDETHSEYIPKINRNAPVREEVYKLEDLVDGNVLNSLNEKASEVLDGDNLKSFELIPFVSAAITILKLSPFTDTKKHERCKILLYINYLAKYAITPVKNMTKKFIICNWSHLVDTHIKQNFSVNGQRPLSMKDKCLSYILVLYLLAKDYEADLEILARDLKVGVKKLIEISRVLAFSQLASKKTTVTLKVPLPPPVTPFIKKRKP